MKTLSISSDGLSIIKQFEGFRPSPYICPAGYKTVGYGHVVCQNEQFSQPLTEYEATQLLLSDVYEAERSVARLITVPLTQRQYDALVSFTFNLGGGALQRSTLRRLVNREEHEDVPSEFLKWVWAGAKRLPGLYRRRSIEANLYESGTLA